MVPLVRDRGVCVCLCMGTVPNRSAWAWCLGMVPGAWLERGRDGGLAWAFINPTFLILIAFAGLEHAVPFQM